MNFEIDGNDGTGKSFRAEEEFHTEADLKKYNERFDFLLDLVKDLPNVIRLNTDTDI